MSSVARFEFGLHQWQWKIAMVCRIIMFEQDESCKLKIPLSHLSNHWQEVIYLKQCWMWCLSCSLKRAEVCGGYGYRLRFWGKENKNVVSFLFLFNWNMSNNMNSLCILDDFSTIRASRFNIVMHLRGLCVHALVEIWPCDALHLHVFVYLMHFHVTCGRRQSLGSQLDGGASPSCVGRDWVSFFCHSVALARSTSGAAWGSYPPISGVGYSIQGWHPIEFLGWIACRILPLAIVGDLSVGTAVGYN